MNRVGLVVVIVAGLVAAGDRAVGVANSSANSCRE